MIAFEIAHELVIPGDDEHVRRVRPRKERAHNARHYLRRYVRRIEQVARDDDRGSLRTLRRELDGSIERADHRVAPLVYACGFRASESAVVSNVAVRYGMNDIEGRADERGHFARSART